MGCFPSKSRNVPRRFVWEETPLNANSFAFGELIGVGGSAKVYRAARKRSGREFAVKVINKARTFKLGTTQAVLREQQMLSQICSEFIVNLQFSFEDRQNFYLGLDLKLGGDLRHYIKNNFKGKEEEIRFIAASIVLALNFLSSEGLVHRDIKPENLIFDSEGYLFLSDFGITKREEEEESDTFGTPGYMAPETVFNNENDYRSDFFSLGILLFEMLNGKRPYKGGKRSEVAKALKDKESIDTAHLKVKWGESVVELVNGFLQLDPTKRLTDMSEIKGNAFFKDFDWDKLSRKTLKSPCKHENSCYFDEEYVKRVERLYLDIAKEGGEIEGESTRNSFQFDRRQFPTLPNTNIKSASK